MDALAGVKVSQSTSNVGREGESEPPGKGFVLVVDVESDVAPLDEF